MNKSKILCLMKNVQDGSADAFAQIYDMCFDSVYYVALQITRNKADAEDVVQETMVNLYRRLGNMGDKKDIQEPGAYIDRIAYNCAIDFVKKRREILFDEETKDILNNVTEDNHMYIPHEFVEKQETQKFISHNLSETLRPVIILFYYHHLSIKEIAHVLDIGESAVKKRLVRGRTVLRKRMENSKDKTALFGMMGFPFLLRNARSSLRKMGPGIYRAKQKIWCEVSHRLNFPSETVASTVALMGFYKHRTAAKILVTSVAGAAIVAGIFWLTEGKWPAIESTPALSAAGLLAGGDALSTSQIYGNGAAADAQSADNSADEYAAQENHSSGPDNASQSPATAGLDSGGIGEEIIGETGYPEQVPPNGIMADTGGQSWQAATPTTPPEQPAKQSEAPREEAGANQANSGAGTSQPITGITAQTAAMETSRRVLRCPKGTTMTAQDILTMANIHAVTAQGEPIVLEITEIETVDFTRAGQYWVFASTTNHNPVLHMGIMIIVGE